MCLKNSTVAEHLCGISANEIELVCDSDCEESFATGVSGLGFTLLISFSLYMAHGLANGTHHTLSNSPLTCTVCLTMAPRLESQCKISMSCQESGMAAHFTLASATNRLPGRCLLRSSKSS